MRTFDCYSRTSAFGAVMQLSLVYIWHFIFIFLINSYLQRVKRTTVIYAACIPFFSNTTVVKELENMYRPIQLLNMPWRTVNVATKRNYCDET